ncbi:hypothetical protein EDB87DRAFT_1833043 [Lactarius vividus]|nr:hypothetical protein EDB87DRAFT_1833043 [Lactarius vividus]
MPGSIHEIDSSITHFQQVLATSPRSDPLPLLCLSSVLFRRHTLSNQREDFDKSIFHLTEAILLPLHSWLEQGTVIFGALFLLARRLVQRSTVSGQPEDAIYAAKYLRYLRDQPHAALGFPRHWVIASLIDALACQTESEASNVVQCIEEMAVLCHELLTSNAPDSDTTPSIICFAVAVVFNLSLWAPDQPLNQVIECLRLVKKHKPDLREARQALVCSAGDSQDEDEAQQLVTILAMIRSVMHKTPEYSEEAMYRTYRARTLPGTSPDKDRFMEISAKQRSRYFQSFEGLNDSDTEVYPTIEKLALLREQLFGIRNNDIREIDEAIEKSRTVLASAPTNLISSILFNVFGQILFEAFQRTKKIEYLNESISTLRQAFECPSIQFLRSMTLRSLCLYLLIRSESFPGHRTQDLDELVKLLSQRVDDGVASLPDRFLFACLWTYAARCIRHPSVPKAYEAVHSTLVKTFDVSHRVPLDYTSYWVDLHRLEEAIETLERGRALLWSEMRHFRASTNQILQVDSQLAHEFAAINRGLEELTKSIPPTHKLSLDYGAADDFRAVDPFGRLLLKQRELLRERDRLISKI